MSSVFDPLVGGRAAASHHKCSTSPSGRLGARRGSTAGHPGLNRARAGHQSSSELGPRGSWEPWIQLGSRRQNQDPECRRLCTFNRAGPKKLQRAQDLGFTAQNAEDKVEAITRLPQEYQEREDCN